MTYRKASTNSMLANSSVNRIVRQAFARQLAESYMSDQEIWHMDESSIQSISHKLSGWFFRFDTGNVTERIMRKSITLIAAISSRGRIVWAAHTEKSNTQSTILFVDQMIQLLDDVDGIQPEPRFICLDCAPYHRSKQFLRWTQSREVRFCFLSKYSFSISPVELLFQHLKSKSLPINSDEYQ